VSIESLITSLVQQAPHLELAAITELRAELERDGTPLALAISRVVELVGEQLVDLAIALPALAEACATLEASTDPMVLEAARYQVDTLVPVPDRPPAEAPDVPIDALRRR
jgi:hypothetical protein